MEMMPWVCSKGILIDIIGTFNGGTANFSIDHPQKSDCNGANHF
jgi:hypothetical protein